MFTRIDKDKITEYFVTNSNVIKKIVFNREFSLDILMFYGKFETCDKLTKHNQGLLGEITIGSTDIIIRTKRVLPEQINALFNTLEEYEPSFKNTKTELMAMCNPGVLKKEPNTTPTIKQEVSKVSITHYDSIGMFTPAKQRIPSYNVDDVKEMFERLTIYKFQKKEFDSIDQISTIEGYKCRTTKAHYRDFQYKSYDEENVCRTTLTDPTYDKVYIECRTTPYQNYGDKEEKLATEKWLIGFSSTEKAQEFLKLLYSKEIISNLQTKYDNHWFNKRKRVADRSNNIIYVNDAVDYVLNMLVESNNCSKEAVQQQIKLFKQNQNMFNLK